MARLAAEFYVFCTAATFEKATLFFGMFLFIIMALDSPYSSIFRLLSHRQLPKVLFVLTAASDGDCSTLSSTTPTPARMTWCRNVFVVVFSRVCVVGVVVVVWCVVVGDLSIYYYG